jgi:predicted enzyme related to lactoylglutathione lyase
VAADGSGLVSGVDFVSVPTRDLDAAVAFYGETLGLLAFFADPDGNALMLHRRYAPRQTDL